MAAADVNIETKRNTDGKWGFEITFTLPGFKQSIAASYGYPYDSAYAAYQAASMETYNRIFKTKIVVEGADENE